LLSPELFKLITWANHYYHHAIGDSFQVALPKKVLTDENLALAEQTYWQKTANDIEVKGKTQKKIVSLFNAGNESLSQNTIYEQLGQCRSSLLSLQQKGGIKPFNKVEIPETNSDSCAQTELNAQQKSIVNKVIQQEGQFQPFLLHGITGSGKTEVYIHLAQFYLSQAKKVLILIPEIGLTDQFVSRFKQQLAAKIVIFNSAMSDKERQHSWLLAQQGHVDIVIGTRSAVFTPLTDLGLIIIDEEHDSSYKQQESLRYHARSLALVRAKNNHIPIVLGSATPSFESLYQVEQQQYHLLELTKRATGAQLPKVYLVDSQGPQLHYGISSELYQAIKKELAADNQVLLFINRRGYAPVLMCHDCGWQANCPQCDAKMVVHKQRYQLRCHHCGFVQPLLTTCDDCGSSNITVHGLGTEQVEQNLQLTFPDVPVLRIDRDSTQRVGAFANLLAEIGQGGAKILVGTQMLAKGHDFHDVTLVGVLDADHGLYSADFRAKEVLAQLITQVTGRAGRGKKSGKVLIQTSQKDDPFWQSVIDHGYKHTAKVLLQQRLESGMPPRGSLCVIRARSKENGHAMQFLTSVADVFRRSQQQVVMVLGPVPAVMEKKAGYYRAQLLLTTQQRRALHQLLDHSMEQIHKIKIINKVFWSIDIDPIDLL
jgi:primosomal protein N' (replication factor Y)